MKVLIGCEFSGIVRDAFAALGHDAWSCDLEPSERPGNHYQCDLRDILGSVNHGFEMAVFHPPCTFVCNAGLNWLNKIPGRYDQMKQALDFVRYIMACNIPLWAIENPLGKISTEIRTPEQIIRPYMFGDNNKKDICLWLKGLPCLMPTNWIKPPYISFSDTLTNNKHRQKIKSRSFAGIAAAMAYQWGAPVSAGQVPVTPGVAENELVYRAPGMIDHTGRVARIIRGGEITLGIPGAQIIPGDKPRIYQAMPEPAYTGRLKHTTVILPFVHLQNTSL